MTEPPDDSSQIDGLVQEIRDALSQITARELELRRREQDFSQQYRQLKRQAQQAAASQYEQTQQRLAERAAELNAQAVEIAARRERLSKLADQLRARQIELEQRRRDWVLLTQRLKLQEEQMRSAWRQRRRVLRQRIEAIRRHEHALHERARLAEDELAARRAELERRAAELDQRAAALNSASQTLLDGQAELDRGLEGLESLAQEVRRQQASLQAERAALEEERARLAESRQSLELAKQKFQAESQRLGQLERDLENRRAELAGQRGQLAEAQAELVAQRKELTGRQSQIEAERRQIEAERAQIAQERTRLEAQLNELRLGQARLAAEQLQLQRQRQADQARPPLRPAVSPAEPDLGPAQPRQAVHTPAAAIGPQKVSHRPRHAAWRLAVAGMVAGLTTSAWWLAHPASHQAATLIRIIDPGPDVRAALLEHRRQLLDPDLLTDDPAVYKLAPAWQLACQNGRVVLATAQAEPALRFTVTDDQADQARQLLEAACQTYLRKLDQGNLVPRGYQDLAAHRRRLQKTLDDLRQRQAADQTRLAELATQNESSPASNPLDNLEAELAEVTREIERARADLSALAATEPPGATVDPQDIDQALAEDPVYREDSQELQAVALQYRTELTVAMLSLIEPFRTFQKAVGGLLGSLQEQLALAPPAELKTILEQCQTETAEAAQGLAPFAEQWREWLTLVQELDLRRQAAELVTSQGRAADAAQLAADQASALVDRIDSRIQALGSVGQGGTRATVVAAVLRSEHALLRSAAQSLAAAARRTALPENFELDAQDRKLRGLLTRLTNRRAAVARDLQSQADRAARDRHAARAQEVGNHLRQLEDRRQRLVADLAAGVRILRQPEPPDQQRDSLQAATRQRQAEIDCTQARLDEIDRALAGLETAGAWKERLEIAPATVRRVSAVTAGELLAVGVAALVLTWLGSGLVPGLGRSVRAAG